MKMYAIILIVSLINNEFIVFFYTFISFGTSLMLLSRIFKPRASKKKNFVWKNVVYQKIFIRKRLQFILKSLNWIWIYLIYNIFPNSRWCIKKIPKLFKIYCTKNQIVLSYEICNEMAKVLICFFEHIKKFTLKYWDKFWKNYDLIFNMFKMETHTNKKNTKIWWYWK